MIEKIIFDEKKFEFPYYKLLPKINEIIEQSNRQDEAIRNIAGSLVDDGKFNKNAFEMIEDILSGK